MTVQAQSTEEHGPRVDPDEAPAKSARHSRTPTARIAMIGAGVSGLVGARTLRDHGLEVTVFEKSRGPGGRTATRRAEPRLRFDHGAQYFTARDPRFIRTVDAWIGQGIVAEWAGRVVEVEGRDVRPKTGQPRRYVGVPGMSAVARHLASDIPVRLETRIVRLDRTHGGWKLEDAAGETHGPFDYVVVTLPSPQAAGLLEGHAFAAEARAVPMTPCWAALVAFERRIAAEWDGAFVHGSPLAWASRDSSKPGRDPLPDCWVLHAASDWSEAHLDLTRDAVAATLLSEFSRIAPAPGPPTIHLDAHRWLFAATPRTLDRPSLFDPNSRLSVCGDWLAGGRVEGAFHSGLSAANHIFQAVGLVPDETAKSLQFGRDD